MLRLLLAFVALLLVLEISPGSSVSRARVRRGYNNNNGGYGGYGTGYGTGYGGSDERDASVSSDGCNSGEDTRSYGGGGRELSFMRDRNDRQKDRSDRGHGSRSFAKASASASASSYNGELRL